MLIVLEKKQQISMFSVLIEIKYGILKWTRSKLVKMSKQI